MKTFKLPQARLTLILTSLCVFFGLSPAFGISCVDLLSKPHHMVHELGVSENNYQAVSDKIHRDFISFLNIPSYLSPDEFHLIKTFQIYFIIHHAIENVVQHGLRTTTDFSASFVKLKAALYSEGSSFYIEITNPQMKAFPESLQTEFFAGDKIVIPETERVGYQGRGVAVTNIVNSLNSLPSYSSVRWSADGESVSFRLKIERPRYHQDPR